MDSIDCVEDMMALQLFNYSIHAEEGLTVMIDRLKEEELTDREKRISGHTLINWGFSFEKDLVEPAIFQRVVGQLL